MSKSDLCGARREFLQRTTSCFALALVAAGLPRELLAMPIGSIEGRTVGSEKSYPIPATDGANIDRQAQVIIARSQGKVMAFALSCPHENAAVKWVEKDQRFQCTKHDSKYTLVGIHMSGRATRNMDRLPIRRDGASVLVDVDHMFRSDTDAAAWASAMVSV
jgi:nitrite reductase/ring-hydroxylating ferredoxin subunit